MFRWLRKASQQARESTKESANDTARVEADFDFKRRALGVNDELKNVPGVTTPMLVAFGESGIKTIDDLAGTNVSRASLTPVISGMQHRQSN